MQQLSPHSTSRTAQFRAARPAPRTPQSGTALPAQRPNWSGGARGAWRGVVSIHLISIRLISIPRVQRAAPCAPPGSAVPRLSGCRDRTGRGGAGRDRAVPDGTEEGGHRRVLGAAGGQWARGGEGMGLYSGFSSDRINLSPFTKDFRGEEQARVSWNFLRLRFGGAIPVVVNDRISTSVVELLESPLSPAVLLLDYSRASASAVGLLEASLLQSYRPAGWKPARVSWGF